MNILRNVRWGYTGDGICCGPVGGELVVELVLEKEDGKLTFMRYNRMDQNVQIDISDHSTFDSFLLGYYDGWELSFDICDFRQEFDENNPNCKVDNLALLLMEKTETLYRTTSCSAYDPVEYDGARDFVREWLHKDIEECDIPIFRLEDEEFWDDEEDEEE